MRLTTSLFIVFMMFFTSKLMSADFKDESNPTVQEVVNKTSESESPTHSEEMSSEDLAAEFLNEMKIFPESQVHQIIYSLQLYAKDYSLEYIIPKNDKFIKLMNTKIKEEYKNIVYLRELKK